MLGYSSILMLCGLYYLVANAWVAQGAYIKHGDHPGEKIWRVWVIWSVTRYAKMIIVLPSLCFLTFTGEAQAFTGYMNIVTVLIQSYAIESMWLLTAEIIHAHPATTFFIETSPYIEYRVSKGTSYESQRGRSNFSSLHWNHSNHAATQLDNANGTDGGDHTSINPESLLVPLPVLGTSTTGWTVGLYIMKVQYIQYSDGRGFQIQFKS
ncbi:hypothetical protein AGABI1DRAFT_109134 [Agaricus bisporus var. burnettii JB137-S8]|uniref:Uncharacterized protein n=1 Tax=Agaricus bisporus var. burnettii (strain JB137-S8 / ATCC MYA-4627 / FGSC 10392) TaxID=597362 RepID=K5WKR4_AGABU|nr:uncharacterized protein AGABI1DRAFT_109134 [Agaricus bisporus var. burnettii JB137-S8]EKM75896.1 hypothetical protein AGABI1DRAFT_109134 [Agaricus bisporus var. burnettii JB137-S8]